MEDYYKISFTGDIMCELPLLKASKRDKIYDFEFVFHGVKDKLSESDIVIGNLETVFAGETAGYTNDVYSFNTPDSFVSAMKKAGINYVSTANNHCLDRGIGGMVRTLDLLDQCGIKYFGTYRSKEERIPYELLEIGDKKIALIAYTYGTNVVENGIVFKDDEEFYVNLLKSQKHEWLKFEKTLNTPGIRSKLSRYIRKVTTLEQRMRLKKRLGMLKNTPKLDELLEGDLYPQYLERLKSDVEKAKSETDYVFVCLHSGGLFNIKVGAYTEYIVDFIARAGADFIVGNHPHVVQKFADKGCLVAYSLGNFSISPSSLYLVRENLPEYSILLHFYFDKGDQSLRKVTFSILKIVESRNGSLSVYPVNVLYDKCIIASERDQLMKDCTRVYNIFTDKQEMSIDILDEYVCFKRN
ncbi:MULTISPECIES: CapA family protein [Butyricimonas]|uniref:CapA family protein n=1 Tax=Butyricimonas TaxID=574697 RepID=UPI0007FB3452|nr:MULTISPECIES: CapA family protein [Butyricimonas]